MAGYAMTIGGAAITGEAWFDVVDPATGQVFESAPACTAAQLDSAMNAAAEAWRDWSADPAMVRDRLLAAAAAVSASVRELAETVTREQGKPLELATGEVLAAATVLRYCAGLELPAEVLRDDRRGYAELVRRPLGVAAAILPWNFPIASAAAKIGPALRAGNAVVVKPSPHTPLATLRLGELLAPVLPEGVLNVVSGDAELGAAMVTHPVAAQISLTGSVTTGRQVARLGSVGLKRYVLELGGNDPAIVLDDADPDLVLDQLFAQSFANNGQACLLIKRLYVPERIYTRVLDGLADRARAARVGDPMTKGTQFGPLTTVGQRDRIAGLVTAAVRAGARAVAGGAPRPGEGYFYPPTVLAGADDGMAVVDEEQFGPALPVVPYRDLDDAVRRANAGPFGLGGSVWSADADRAWQVADRLDCGTVWVNAHAVLDPGQPVAGRKHSGIGIENGVLGLHEYTALQVRRRPPTATT